MTANSTPPTQGGVNRDTGVSVYDVQRNRNPASPHVYDLADVSATSVADGQTLVWSQALGAWVPGAPPVIFDFPGPLAIAVSDLLAPAAGAGFTKIQFSLRSTGSTATQVGVYKTGALVGTATIPASTALYTYAISVSLAAGVDTLQLRISQPGVGAAGLVASVG